MSQLLCWVILMAVAAPPLIAQTDTNVYRLNLRGRGTLTDVFESGLRPKQLSSSDTYHCFVDFKLIQFDLGENITVTIPVELCDFKVFGTNQSLSEIRANTFPLTLDEARGWMSPICRTFGKSQAQLDAFLEKVGHGHRRFGWLGNEDEEGFGVGTPRPAPESGRAAIVAGLRSYGGNTNTPVEIAVSVYWEPPRREFLGPLVPLQPPKGYEQFSMAPERPYTPEWIRQGLPAPPLVQRDLGSNGVQRLRDEYLAMKGLTNSPTPFHPFPPEFPASPTQK
jgi:hypothetical protein